MAASPSVRLTPVGFADIVERVLKHRKGRATLWVLTKDDLARCFDRVLAFDHGRLVDDKVQQAVREAAQ